MALTSHKVAGIYRDHQRARDAVDALRRAGIGEDAIAIANEDDWRKVFTGAETIAGRAKDTIAVGAGVGAGVGAAGTGALAAAGVAVIAAAPVLAMLAGAGLGAVAGTAYAGASSSSVRESAFRDVVHEAVELGNAVVVVRASSETEALAVQDLVARTAPERSVDQFGGQHG